MKINEIAASMVSKGKGILAADESTGTMTKRLSGVKIESNEKIDWLSDTLFLHLKVLISILVELYFMMKQSDRVKMAKLLVRY